MDADEVLKVARLEDRHWWYVARRRLLARLVHGRGPGVAVDIGAAGGGNTRVLRDLGWRAVAVEYGREGALVARQRSLAAVRADAAALPVATGSVDLAVAFDVLEHLQDDGRAVCEAHRVLRAGGTLLVAVPADMRLWSAHDDAVGHVRRYDRDGLVRLLASGGFAVGQAGSWNVLLRPVVRLRRRRSTGSDLEPVPRPLNAALLAVASAERHLPVGGLPGVSLVAVATAG